ncbi:MAG: PqqD family protein [Anaerolineae bacterium]|nr:PqqD family protein [Anaerolineae bacterium]
MRGIQDEDNKGMSGTKKPRRKPGYHLEMLENELLLFNPEQTLVLYFNETASVVWELCDGQRTVSEIVFLLSEAYPEARKAIESDVNSTLDQLFHHGVIDFA